MRNDILIKAMQSRSFQEEMQKEAFISALMGAAKAAIPTIGRFAKPIVSKIGGMVAGKGAGIAAKGVGSVAGQAAKKSSGFGIGKLFETGMNAWSGKMSLTDNLAKTRLRKPF